MCPDSQAFIHQPINPAGVYEPVTGTRPCVKGWDTGWKRDRGLPPLEGSHWLWFTACEDIHIPCVWSWYVDVEETEVQKDKDYMHGLWTPSPVLTPGTMLPGFCWAHCSGHIPPSSSEFERCPGVASRGTGVSSLEKWLGATGAGEGSDVGPPPPPQAR